MMTGRAFVGCIISPRPDGWYRSAAGAACAEKLDLLLLAWQIANPDRRPPCSSCARVISVVASRAWSEQFCGAFISPLTCESPDCAGMGAIAAVPHMANLLIWEVDIEGRPYVEPVPLWNVSVGWWEFSENRY